MFEESKLDTTKIIYNIVRAKDGLEIGGSSNCDILYKNVNRLDNLDLIKKDTNLFSNEKVLGVNFNCDATEIKNIKDNQYDFVFASNILQYIANPLKALKEWNRILKTGGFIILKFTKTHDKVSSLKKIIEHYMKNVKEDDLSSLPNIMDNKEITNEKFIRESLSNYHYRKLKHFNYDIDLLNDMTDYLNLDIFYYKEEKDDLYFIIN